MRCNLVFVVRPILLRLPISLRSSHHYLHTWLVSHCTQPGLRQRPASLRLSVHGLSTAVSSLPAGGETAAGGRLPCSEPSKPLQGGLYVVSTPIGNLEDITLRALRILRQATLILAEDTRHTLKLLNHYGVRTPLMSFHEHNEHYREAHVRACGRLATHTLCVLRHVLEHLRSGAAVALVSDAGVPAVSDPGAALVAATAAAGLRVVPVPGPSAVLAALVASGLPTAEFHFAGFLPPKAHARRQRLAALAGVQATLLLFVPPHALAAVLADAAQVVGAERRCVVARELTKMHEELFRASLGEAAAEFGSRAAKGEVTLVVEGAAAAALPSSEADLAAALRGLLAAGLPASQAARQLAGDLGVPRGRVYALATALRAEAGAPGAAAAGFAEPDSAALQDSGPAPGGGGAGDAGEVGNGVPESPNTKT